MVAFFVDAAELLGVPKSVAAIYGIVFASPEPLTFSDIELRVNFSKGSVSQGLRVLREVGAIKEAAKSKMQGAASPLKIRGHHSFEPDLQLRKLIAHFLEQRLETQLSSGSSRLTDLEAMVPATNKEAAKELSRRLKSLSDWHTRARQLLPLARTFLKLS